MNVFGIDYGRTSSIIVLREGDAVIRSVGDGLRTLIPHAAKTSVDSAVPLWGSHALLTPLSKAANASAARTPLPTPSQKQNDDFLEEALRPPDLAQTFSDLSVGPWIDEPEAALFWGGLQDRLYRYLGRMAATEVNGYRVVAAITPGVDRGAPAALSRFAHSAGLSDIDIIRATDALVCRFIASPTGTGLAASDFGAGEPLVAVSVALGDVATEVDAYRLSPHNTPNIAPILGAERIDSSRELLPYGQAHCLRHLLRSVHEHLREPLPPGQELLLQDAAREFGASLGRQATDDTVMPWNGPFRDRMYAPLRLSIQDCLRDWPEARGLVSALPPQIQDAARAAGATDGVPDIVLLGGVGARWPFAIHAARQIAAGDFAQKPLIWSSDAPDEDVARGAAWWPNVGAVTLPALRGDAPAQAVKAVRPKSKLSTSAPKPIPEMPPVPAAESTVPPSLRQLDF